MSDWLVIGSAPTVVKAFGELPLLHYTTITCNNGIRLVPFPDYYLIYDQDHAVAFEGAARLAQANGTHLVTIHRSNKEALRRQKLDFYDEYIQVDHGPHEPTREQWGRPAWSGQMCVEYACRNGATSIHLVGMDGYRKGNDYFDAATYRKPLNNDAFPVEMNEVKIRPRMQSLTDAFPEIQFVQYGDPVYDVDRENWEVVRVQLNAERQSSANMNIG